MAPRLPSASGVERAVNCPGAYVLPEVGHAEEAPQAAFGHAVHLFLEHVPKVGAEKALELVPEEFRAFCEALPLERLPVQAGQTWAEAAFALDLATGRAKHLGNGIGRAYPKVFDAQINGSADVVAFVGNDSLYVADYKTGSDFHVPEPEVNRQLKTLALMASAVLGRFQVKSEIIFIREGMVWKKSAEYDDLTLDAHLVELRDMAQAIQAESLKAAPDVCEGPWCRYCPAYKVCPAKAKLASALVIGQDPTLTLPLSTETVPTIWQRLEEAELLLKTIRSTVEGFVRQEPVPMPNGMVLGPVETTRRTLDARKLHAILSSRFGFEVADRAVEWESSQERLKDVLRDPVRDLKAKGEKASITALTKEILMALEDAGGVTKATSSAIRLHRPKAEAA